MADEIWILTLFPRFSRSSVSNPLRLWRVPFFSSFALLSSCTESYIPPIFRNRLVPRRSTRRPAAPCLVLRLAGDRDRRCHSFYRLYISANRNRRLTRIPIPLAILPVLPPCRLKSNNMRSTESRNSTGAEVHLIFRSAVSTIKYRVSVSINNKGVA